MSVSPDNIVEVFFLNLQIYLAKRDSTIVPSGTFVVVVQDSDNRRL